MMKNIFIALLLVAYSVKAQDTIRVKMEPNNDYKWMMLYKVSGAKQQYIANTTLDNGEYKLVIPKGKEAGIYRLFYDLDNGGFLDFIYNNESVSITFNPKLPQETVKFEKSEDNKLYKSYLNAIYHQQGKLDSLQMAYFETTNKENLKEEYTSRLTNLRDIQAHFEKASVGKIAHDFIVATKKYNGNEPAETPDDYLKTIENHFFDYLDFDNKALLNSSVFVDKVIEYVFYINSSDDEKTDNELKKKAIAQAVAKIGDNDFVKSEVLSSLLYAYANQEKVEMVDYIKATYYDKLPTTYQDTKFLSSINDMLKVAVGRVAPEITWKEGKITKRLSALEGAEKYVVVFWSTTCSHCLKEIPEVYKFTKDLDDVKVIGVVLEEDEFGFNHHTEPMDKWINVLSINKENPSKKWEAKLPRSYNVYATPTYIVLDKDKKITAKPKQLGNLLNSLGADKETINEIYERLTKDKE